MFTFKPFHFGFFTLSLLTMHLLTACGASQAEVKDYTSTGCLNGEKPKLTKNVVTLASNYYIFNQAMIVPDFAEVKLSHKYATGKSEVLSGTFRSQIAERLRYDGLNSYNVQVTSLLEMSESIDKNQILKFSRPCQITQALLDNEQLRSEPAGVFYLLSSKKNFIILRDGAYGPEPIIPLKFKLRNPNTNQVEEVTFHLHDIVGGDFFRPPSTLVQQIQNWGKREENNSQNWKITKHVQTISGQDYDYFTVSKESPGLPIVGEILGIEFVLAEKD